MHDFEQRLALAWPISQWSQVPIIIAVSGGADSVALLRGLVSLAGSSRSHLVVGHFDHRLRCDSQGDADFVLRLCRQLQVPCELGAASEIRCTSGAATSEQAARDARYEFLKHVARQVGARFLATAHTADDQAETILHRILRGTGIHGLAGIPASRELISGVTLARPLLDFQRSEILAYLDDLQQPFCRDATNSDEQFTRNRIRNVLLPALRSEYNPLVDDSLRRLGRLAGETSSYVESVASQELARCVQFDSNSVSIDLSQLTGVHPLIVRTMLRQIWQAQGWPEREMTFERWHELEQLAQNPNGDAGIAISLPVNIRAKREGMRLAITGWDNP